MRPVFADIQATLRVPIVNYFFRLLANWPDYFEPTWAVLAPGLGSMGFERAADLLRSMSALPPAAADWVPSDGLESIYAFTDTIHYVLPKLLLIATCLDLGLAPQAPEALLNPSDRKPLTHAVAPKATTLSLVTHAEAQHTVQKIFDDVRLSHGHPGVASYYRGIAHWPDFLSAMWKLIRPRVLSETYRIRKRNALRLARTLVEDRLAAQPLIELTHSPPPPDAAAVIALFRHRLTVDLLLDVGLIQGILHDRSRARVSPLSEGHLQS